MGFLLKFLIIFLVINFVFKLVFRYLLPMVVRNQFDKMAGGFNNGQNPFEQFQKQNQAQNESEEKVISVKKAPNEEENKKMNGAGDYIEFEEVKE